MIDFSKYKTKTSTIDFSKYREKTYKTKQDAFRTVSLPEHLGGGEYKTAGAGTLEKTPRAYGGYSTKKDFERDHIVSVALGGTSSKENIQYLPNDERGRQAGKVSTEQKTISAFQRDDISLPQARRKVATKQQQIQGLTPMPEEQELSGFMKIVDSISTFADETGDILGTSTGTMYDILKIKSGAIIERGNLAEQYRKENNLSSLSEANSEDLDRYIQKNATQGEKARQLKEKADISMDKGWLTLNSAIATTGAKFASVLGMESIQNTLEGYAKGDQQAVERINKFEIETGLAVDNTKKFKEKIKDPNFILEGVFTNIPNMIALGGLRFGATKVATTLGVSAKTAGRIGTGAGFAGAGSLEGGLYYQEAKKGGASEREATAGATIVGITNGILEMLPIENLFRRNPAIKVKVKKNILDGVFKNVKRAFTQASFEAGTESLQEIVSNATAKTYDENRNLFDNVGESAFFGGLLGGGASLVFDTIQKTEGKIPGLTIEDSSKEEATIEGQIKKAKAEGKSFDEFVGKQKKVYHGTTADFKNFDFKLTGKSSGETPVHNLTGTWFVDNKIVAKGYGKNIKEVSLDTSNFYKIDANGKTLNNFRDEIWNAKKFVSDNKRPGLVIENLIDNADFSKSDIGTHIFVADKNAIKTKSQLKDIWKKAQEEITPKLKSKKTKPLSGAEQLNIREDEKLARETEKIKRETLIFYEEDFETQYQQFKKLITPKKLWEIEDEAQLKKVLDSSPEKVDNILYSQTRIGDEVFQMFKERRIQEIEPLPKVSKETRAMISEKARRSILTEKEKVNRRRKFINAAKNYFGLSDNDLKKISQKDIRLMNNFQFKQYIDRIRTMAVELQKTKQKKNELITLMAEKEFIKVENLRKSMDLPPISKMSNNQIDKYIETLEQFQTGDTFLTERQLEIVTRSDLAGIKTMREAREILADKLNVPVDSLDNMKVNPLDSMKYDSALANKNPFFGFIVKKTQEKILIGEQIYLEKERKINDLARKAKKSRKGGILNKLSSAVIPTNEEIISYLEATPDNKEEFAVKLTKEELDYANYIEQYYNEAYNHLVQIKELYGSRFVDQYFTHTRKTFLENWKDNGIINAFREAYKSNQEDQLTFNILDQDTGDILNKSKFFQYTLNRTGSVAPSQNLTRVFKNYVRTFERKRTLDSLIPEVDIYTDSLTPKDLTPKGLEMDRSLKKFFNKYLNNKKGRKESFGGLIKQNGFIDLSLKAGNMFVSVFDLGLNIGASTAASVGEQIMTIQTLGAVKYAKAWKRKLWDIGIKRKKTKQGEKILKKYEGFIGRNFWSEIAEPGKQINTRVMEGLFALYAQSSVEANKLALLGMMTKEEFASGNLAPGRLAEIKIDAGRWRDMGKSVRSIVGSTSLGSTLNKYKTWAIPILGTTVQNLNGIAGKIKQGNFKQALTEKEMKETIREIMLTGAVIIIGSYVIGKDEDDSFLGRLKARIYMEAQTIMGGLSIPMFLSTPRLYSFIQSLANNIDSIIKLEEYETTTKWGEEGDLKGAEGLKRQLIPRAFGQFKTTTKKTSSSELDKIWDSGSKTQTLDDIWD